MTSYFAIVFSFKLLPTCAKLKDTPLQGHRFRRVWATAGRHFNKWRCCPGGWQFALPDTHHSQPTYGMLCELCLKQVLQTDVKNKTSSA